MPLALAATLGAECALAVVDEKVDFDTTEELLIWAVAYRLLTPVQPIDNLEAAVYFSAVTFTTLGYGDITLSSEQWRLLTGIEALNGVLLLGWSTALLYAVVHRTWSGYAASHLRHARRASDPWNTDHD